jgi:hypothetical protein
MFCQRFIYTAMRREQSDGGDDGCVILQQPCGVIATAGNRWLGGYKFHVTQLSPLEGAKLAKGVLSKAASRSHHRRRGIATAAVAAAAAAARRRWQGFPTSDARSILSSSSSSLRSSKVLERKTERERAAAAASMYVWHTHIAVAARVEQRRSWLLRAVRRRRLPCSGSSRQET